MRSDNLRDDKSQTRDADKRVQSGSLAIQPAPAETAILTRKECAAWLSISVRQLARLDVPCVKLGRLVRYSVPCVLRWMDEGGQP